MTVMSHAAQLLLMEGICLLAVVITSSRSTIQLLALSLLLCRLYSIFLLHLLLVFHFFTFVSVLSLHFFLGILSTSLVRTILVLASVLMVVMLLSALPMDQSLFGIQPTGSTFKPFLPRLAALLLFVLPGIQWLLASQLQQRTLSTSGSKREKQSVIIQHTSFTHLEKQQQKDHFLPSLFIFAIFSVSSPELLWFLLYIFKFYIKQDRWRKCLDRKHPMVERRHHLSVMVVCIGKYVTCFCMCHECITPGLQDYLNESVVHEV